MTIKPVTKCEGTYVPPPPAQDPPPLFSAVPKNPPALDPPTFEDSFDEPTNRPLPEIFQEVLDVDDVLSGLYAQISEANRRKEELLLEFQKTALEEGYCCLGTDKEFFHKGNSYKFYFQSKPFYFKTELVEELK